MEQYRQKYGRQDVDDEACRHQVQEELDRMECQDDRQQVEQQQSMTHHCCSCRRRLEYDNIAIETDDDIMQHDNISSCEHDWRSTLLGLH